MPTFIFLAKRVNLMLLVLLSVFLYNTNGYAVGGYGVITIVQAENPDSDGDGVVDSEDAFPDDVTEWADSDGDGIGNNADTDDDNDGVADAEDAFPEDSSEWVDTDNDGTGNNSDTDDDGDTMPDNWEILYGLDPLVDDASGDLDSDGINNLAECIAGTDPTISDNTDTDTDTAENTAPEQPVLTAPVNDSCDVALIPDFAVGDFIDPDEGDTHEQTEWQISLCGNFSLLIFDRNSTSALVSAVAPGALLESGTEYFWRVRFYDNAQNVSAWSSPYSFTTRSDYPVDDNNNGIPDNQEVNSSVDLDNDGNADKSQAEISSLNNSLRETQVGIKGYNNVAEIEFAMIMDPGTVLGYDYRDFVAPFGLVTYRLLLEDAGENTAKIKIYFSEPVSYRAEMFVYDPFSGLSNYSDHITFSSDRMSAVMVLKDGGYGDADGIENGVIVNSGSIIMATRIGDAISAADNAEILNVVSSADESTSCFIHIASDAKNCMMFTFLLILSFAGVVVINFCKRLTGQGA